MSVSFDPMTITLPDDVEAVVLHPGPPRYRYSDEEFARFCAEYPYLRIEMNSAGEVIIMTPVASEGGKRNFTLTGRFGAWVKRMAQAWASTHRPDSLFPTARNARLMFRGSGASVGAR